MALSIIELLKRLSGGAGIGTNDERAPIEQVALERFSA